LPWQLHLQARSSSENQLVLAEIVECWRKNHAGTVMSVCYTWGAFPSSKMSNSSTRRFVILSKTHLHGIDHVPNLFFRIIKFVNRLISIAAIVNLLQL
jgi:hypothetical protein